MGRFPKLPNDQDPISESSSCLSRMWHSTHPDPIDIANLSDPNIHTRIFPFLDNVDLRAFICDTQRGRFCIPNFYQLNP